MESSPIKMVSVKSRSLSKKVGGVSPTGPLPHAVNGQTCKAHGHLPSFFYQFEDYNSHPHGFFALAGG
jgi:hypothetical protein